MLALLFAASLFGMIATGDYLDEKSVLDSIEVRSAYNRKLLDNHVYDYQVSSWAANDITNLKAPGPNSHNMTCKFVDTDSCVLFFSKYHEEQAQIDLAMKNKETLQMPFSSMYIIVNKLTGDRAQTGHLFSDISLFPGKFLMTYNYSPYDMAVYGQTGRGTVHDLLNRSRNGEVKVSDFSSTNQIIKFTTSETASELTNIRQWELAADRGYSVLKLVTISSRKGIEQSRLTALFEDYQQDSTGLWFPRTIVRYVRRLDGLWNIDLTRYSNITTPDSNACSLVTLPLPTGRAIILGDVPFSAIHPEGPTVVNTENLHGFIVQCQSAADARVWSKKGFFEKYRLYLLATFLLLGTLGGWIFYNRWKKGRYARLTPS